MNKGLTLVEMLISSVILTILMLSLGQFSFDILNVAEKHSGQVEKTQSSRFSQERITEQIRNASYIFPKGQDISFTIEFNADTGYSYASETVNTNNAIALLVPFAGDPYYQGSETPVYNLIVFYLDDNEDGTSNLREFSTAYPNVYWSINSIPDAGSAYGNSTILANNIITSSSDLSYILSYKSSSTDTVLRSEGQNAEVDDENALVKGIDWYFTLQKNNTDIDVKGISRNVPRNLE